MSSSSLAIIPLLVFFEDARINSPTQGCLEEVGSMSAKAPPRVGRRPRATELDKVIGERLRARRLLLQLSQSDLAEQLGCTFQQVQKYENGTNRVSAATLSRVAALLGAPL